MAERPDGELGAVARVVSNGDGTAEVQADNRQAMRLFVGRLRGRAVRYDDGVAVVRVPTPSS